MSAQRLTPDEIRHVIEEVLQHPESYTENTQTWEDIYQKLSIYQQELEYQNDELRRTTEELGASREMWKKLFEDAPTAYALLSHDGYLITGNQRFRALSRKADRLQKILAPESQDIFFLRWRELILRGTCEPATVVVPLTQGKAYYRWEGALWPGEPGQVLVTLTDITGEVLAREELAQAKKMESIGLLAGGIAHDFNNLLEAIFARLEVAKERAHDPALKKDLEHIADAADLASQLTKRLLGYARRQLALPRRLELGVEVSRLYPTLQSLSAPAVLTLLPSPTVFLIADPDHLTQIFTNLCTNARDASNEFGLVTLGWAVIGQEVEITITDQGSGMDAETASKAFEPFFTTKPHGRGTGLGLATVEGLVKQNGGRIYLETAPGQGTSVKFTLPLGATESEPTNSEP